MNDDGLSGDEAALLRVASDDLLTVNHLIRKRAGRIRAIRDPWRQINNLGREIFIPVINRGNPHPVPHFYLPKLVVEQQNPDLFWICHNAQNSLPLQDKLPVVALHPVDHAVMTRIECGAVSQHPKFLQLGQITIRRGQFFRVFHRLAQLVYLPLQPGNVQPQLVQLAGVQLGRRPQTRSILARIPQGLGKNNPHLVLRLRRRLPRNGLFKTVQLLLHRRQLTQIRSLIPHDLTSLRLQTSQIQLVAQEPVFQIRTNSLLQLTNLRI